MFKAAGQRMNTTIDSISEVYWVPVVCENDDNDDDDDDDDADADTRILTYAFHQTQS